MHTHPHIILQLWEECTWKDETIQSTSRVITLKLLRWVYRKKQDLNYEKSNKSEHKCNCGEDRQERQDCQSYKKGNNSENNIMKITPRAHAHLQFIMIIVKFGKNLNITMGGVYLELRLHLWMDD